MVEAPGTKKEILSPAVKEIIEEKENSYQHDQWIRKRWKKV
jgi:hypothetical protein